MGHTKPPFTVQFEVEKKRFAQFRRGMIVKSDKRLFDDLWNRSEFHVPAADKAVHPLPIATIMMMMNLEQEKVIQRLQNLTESQAIEIKRLKQHKKKQQISILYLQEQLETLESRMEKRLKEQLKAFRSELLEIKYDEYYQS
jgi:hypothetical protein